MENIFVSHIEDCKWQQNKEFGNFRWKYLVDSSQNKSHGLSCGLVQIPVGEQLELHSHSPQEIYLIRFGEGTLLQNNFPKRKLRKDSIVYIPMHVPHGLKNTGRKPLEVIWIFPTDSWEEVKYIFDKTPV